MSSGENSFLDKLNSMKGTKNPIEKSEKEDTKSSNGDEVEKSEKQKDLEQLKFKAQQVKEQEESKFIDDIKSRSTIEQETQKNNKLSEKISEVEEEIQEEKDTQVKVVKKKKENIQRVALQVVKNGIIHSINVVIQLAIVFWPITLMIVFSIILIQFLYSIFLQYSYVQQAQLEDQVTSEQVKPEDQIQIISEDGRTVGGPGVPHGSPVNGTYDIRTFNYHREKEFLTAMDMKSTDSPPDIKSTMAGTVLYISRRVEDTGLREGKWCPVKNTTDNYNGNLVVIGNKDTGYVTVYLHFATTNPNLKIGDTVGYGTILGQMGSTGCSTGPHLHYELRKGPPLVDASKFAGYNRWGTTVYTRAGYPAVSESEYLSSLGKSLVALGKLKFDQDLFNTYSVSQNITADDFEKMTAAQRQMFGELNNSRMTPCGVQTTYKSKGNTEKERLASVLSRSFVQGFNNPDDYYRAGAEGQVDPTLLVCIALNDSGGGRVMKGNNIGNVFNTDSNVAKGQRKSFATPRDGISAMGKYALNGSYMKDHQTIWDLSICKPITEKLDLRSYKYYASDVEWLPKIIGCMSNIKNMNIPLEYKFRRPGGKDPNTSMLSSLVTNVSTVLDGITSNKQVKSVIESLVSGVTKILKTNDYTSDSSLTKFVSQVQKFNVKDYTPSNLVTIVDTNSLVGGQRQLRKEANDALVKMSDKYYQDTKQSLVVVSAYRDYKKQLQLEASCSGNFCAKAGYSEHQSGLAFDLFSASTESEFLKKYKSEYQWLSSNAHLFGFTQSYKKGTLIDGYEIEPWHYRFVGIQFATELQNQGLSFTEFMKTK